MRYVGSSLVVAAVVSMAYGASADGFREDEIFCEDAVAHLAKCCPGFEPRDTQCEYSSTGGSCDTTTTYPALDEPTSKCILQSDCASLITNGTCDRAAAAQPKVTSPGDGGIFSGSGVQTTGGSSGVCP